MHVLLPFADDSTLFFARKMAPLLQAAGARVTLGHLTGLSALTPRQLAEALPEGGAVGLAETDISNPETVFPCDAIVTSRMVAPLLVLAAATGPRPRVIAFQGGLDFRPEAGFLHRRDADGVFLVPRADLGRLARWRAAQGLPPQAAGFGHPAFLIPGAPAAPTGSAITFFAQAVSPLTRPARAHMVGVLAALARRHPGRAVRIKLRHLPGENRRHLHRERFDYPALLAGLKDRPANLTAVAGTMAETMQETGVGITCTSTAAADLVAAGVPTLIHLDYPENYLDPLVAPMRDLFAGSGLIADLTRLLALDARPPDPDWLAGMFCPRDLGARVLAMIRGEVSPP
jgi:hypothetical protein